MIEIINKKKKKTFNPEYETERINVCNKQVKNHIFVNLTRKMFKRCESNRTITIAIAVHVFGIVFYAINQFCNGI